MQKPNADELHGSIRARFSGKCNCGVFSKKTFGVNSCPPQVTFDTSKHLSELAMRKRNLERMKLQELERQREEQKRREKEQEEQRKEEERCG